MNDEVLAIVGAIAIAFIVRLVNVVVEWLAKVLHVQAPEPIDLKQTLDHTGQRKVDKPQEAPDPKQSAPIIDQ